MACFIAPLTEAIAVSAITKIIERKSEKDSSFLNETEKKDFIKCTKENLKSLSRTLWIGSSVLLADHILSGEISFRFPFFTSSPHEVLFEIATVGSGLCVLITASWAIFCIVKEKRVLKRKKA